MHLLSCFPGWTWEYVDEHMTIPRLAAITKYQATHPPVHWLVAAYMGVGEKKGGPTKAAVESGLAEDGSSLFDLFPTARN